MGKGFTLAYLPSDEEGARRIFQKTRDALALLANWLGPPPANAPTIAIVEIPAGWGSQADRLAGIILTADSFHDASRLQELYHELAHLWNPHDLDRPSPRWNEGLGRWIQELVAQELDGVKPSAVRTLARVLGPDDERLARVPLASYGAEGMTDWSYGVGRLYFQLLEELVGRAPLLAAIRDLGQERRAKGATLRDLTTLLEARFPDAVAVDADWIWSAGWRAKLAEKGSVEALAASYRAGILSERRFRFE